KGKSFNALYEVMNTVNSKFEKLRSDKEVHVQYLKTLVEHVKVGIVSFDSVGKIHLVNQAFKDIFNLQNIRHNAFLTDLDKDYVEIFNSMKPDENIVKEVSFPGGHITLALQATVFKIENEEFKLISAQNIKEELEQQEIMAWQKLIRVLTHEIMNSVTPISSLSSSLHSLITNKTYNEDVKSKLVNGLEAIINRSDGLMKFTEAYKSLSRIPPPILKPVSSVDFMDRIEMLCNTVKKDTKLELKTHIDPKPWVFYIDQELFDNVIINLVKNAMESMSDKSNHEIEIYLRHSIRGKTILKIKDKGIGISEDVMNEIFVPFCTTKREGSGIGLSISNQIVRSHGGTLSAKSELDEGSEFTITI
ncbi:MAG: ATP-binding protein, partial [Bacteroidales bacterium]|nr:ATP-binding protein [Bacteroidales bacterium]